MILASTGIGTILVVAIGLFGVVLMTYGNGMVEDPTNPKNFLSFAASAGFAATGGGIAGGTAGKLGFKTLYKSAMGGVKGTGKRISQNIILSGIGVINSADSLVTNSFTYGFENLPNRQT